MAAYRDLPSAGALLEQLGDLDLPHAAVVGEVRRALAAARAAIADGRDPIVESLLPRIRASLRSLATPSLRRVINATGVVLHTNLGRAPLAAPAAAGYSNLEYDLATGRRGKRDTHIAALIERIAGAPGIAVNNNAAAVYLILNELAEGGEVVVSRGELIEIGDGFRIPDIMRRAGAELREVGTTNRTRLDDYRDAITDRTRLLLRVHPSNFHIAGFTAKPELSELAALARERRVPLYEDLGSGCVADLRAYGVDEPLVAASIGAGCDLISFSGDKLLGGPQAGIIAGRADLVARIRRNPMFRALRLDKLITAALSDTLRHLLAGRHDEIPALRMIALSAEAIRLRAQALASQIPGAEVIEGQSVIGGGSTPGQSLPTWLVALSGDAVQMERRLRNAEPPIIARIQNDRVVLDLRTVDAADEAAIINYTRS